MLTVDQAIKMLGQNGITKSEQMLRRWLREGRIKGTRTANRKEGWLIDTKDLNQFIEEVSPVLMYQKEIAELKTQVTRLETENQDLRQKLEKEKNR